MPDDTTVTNPAAPAPAADTAPDPMAGQPLETPVTPYYADIATASMGAVEREMRSLIGDRALHDDADPRHREVKARWQALTARYGAPSNGGETAAERAAWGVLGQTPAATGDADAEGPVYAAPKEFGDAVAKLIETGQLRAEVADVITGHATELLRGALQLGVTKAEATAAITQGLYAVGRTPPDGAATLKGLKTEWGDGFHERLVDAACGVRFLEEHAVPGLGSYLNESGAGDDPQLIRLFARMGARARGLLPASAVDDARTIVALNFR